MEAIETQSTDTPEHEDAVSGTGMIQPLTYGCLVEFSSYLTIVPSQTAAQI